MIEAQLNQIIKLLEKILSFVGEQPDGKARTSEEPDKNGYFRPGKLRDLTYTPAELAAVLNMGRSKVYQGLRDGTIPSIKFGRRIVIPKAAIQRWLTEQGVSQ